MKFTNWLIQAMQEKKWTNSDLAREARLSRQAIGYYVAGRIPDREATLKIAKAFDVDENMLLGLTAGNVLPEPDQWVVETQRGLMQLPEDKRRVVEILIDALRKEELAKQKK